MASSTFISWICHFWAQFWLNFNFGDFRAYFSHFSLVKIDFFKTIFQSWRIKLRVLKFFRPILIIKRHQKNTQAKLFEKFASRQHALLVIEYCAFWGWGIIPAHFSVFVSARKVADWGIIGKSIKKAQTERSREEKVEKRPRVFSTM